MRKTLSFIFLFIALITQATTVKVSSVYTEQMSNPLGLDTTTPRFSWQMQSDGQGVMQTAYRILVASSVEMLTENKADLWDSGCIESEQSLWVSYNGVKLKSNQRAFWKVKCYTNQGETSWSEVAQFGIGLLNEGHWRGQWIGMDRPAPWDSETQWSRLASRYLRKEFATSKVVKRATLHIAGMGMYEAFINGTRIGEQVLAPAPTDYRKTIIYNSFDVTRQLASDTIHAIGVTLGNGRFYTMRQNYKPYKIANFGYPKLRLNLIIEYIDGSCETLVSDKSWKLTADGPIRSNNEYDGERYDARKELGEWTCVGYDDSKWGAAERVSIPTGTLRGAMAPNMKVLRSLKPVSMRRQGEKWILDMGQNMVGWVRMNVRGELGDSIKLRFAELLQPDGELYVKNLRDAKVTDTYICNARENNATWAPRFVYHGFRYVEVSGFPTATINDFVGEVVSDEMEELGTFTTSNETLNRIHQNAWWGILGNYKGMPVDCPQRNERQPWLGDRTMGTWGESYLFGNGPLYSKWIRDICEAQREDGCIPDVAPAYWNYYSDNMTWPAALFMSVDMCYTQYGNTLPMRQSYASMKRWMNHMVEEYMTDEYIFTKDRYGDWCVPPESLDMIHSRDPKRVTEGALIATAYGAKLLQTLHRFAEVLGYETDKQYWMDLEHAVKDAFNRKYLTVKRGTSLVPGHVLYPDSVYYGNNTVTANILPLAFGLVPKDCLDDVVKSTVQSIVVTNKEHISCGVIGVQWLLRELSRRGFADVAYMLATNTTYPSWGYMVEQGATAIWELWNGNTANPAMNSGNHVMLLGDFLPWCYENLAGIKSERGRGKVGFKHIRMCPNFEIQDISYVDASYRTPYGRVVSRWKKTLQHLEWDIEIPVNTFASVYLPNGKVEKVGSGKYHFSVDIPAADKCIVTDEFLYEDAGFPQCHGATVVELENGDLVAAFFGGTREKNPDCNIWTCRKPYGSKEWTKPYKAADGIYTKLTAAAFSERDLSKFAARDSIIDELLRDKPNVVQQDRFALFREAMLRMGGAREAAPAVPMGDGKNYPWWMAPAKNSGKPLVDETWRKPCYNPVLFQIPGGDLVLYYKIGYGVGDWTGWQVRSKNGGKTWGKPEALAKGFLGPIKNKPVYINGRIIAPSSTEGNGWKFHFEISDDKGKTWKYVGPVDAEYSLPTALRKAGIKKETGDDLEAGEVLTEKGAQPILCIQPSILLLKDGRLMAIGRTRNAKLAVTYSSDCGDTWSKVVLSDLPNNNSGTDAVTLADGRQVVVFNDFATLPGTPKGVRTPVSIAVSEDDGKTWKNAVVLEDSPISQYSYPSIIQGKDGKLHCVYTWRRKRIAYKAIELK